MPSELVSHRGWRGLTGRAAEDCERRERKYLGQLLSKTIAEVAAKIKREIVFYRLGLPATVPAWAQEIADDKTVVNLQTVLSGAYLAYMARDPEHASRHQARVPWTYCPHCIAIQWRDYVAS